VTERARVFRRLTVVENDYYPAYVVWELTLRCDQPCTHCGSRAGAARSRELTTEEALAVVAQLADMRTREVVLIGGEAYLHPGYLEIVAALRSAGIKPSMTTGGRRVDRTIAEALARAGIYLVSVSIDGMETAHDLQRAAPGSFRSATAALRHLREAGIKTACNTNLNRLNRDDLETLYEHLREQQIVAWQVQITAPLGRAADRPELILQPWDLLDLVPRIAALKKRAYADGVLLSPGNNLGYFGPEEALLRSTEADGADHWQGCQAGRYVMGIESGGVVKGCPSLQTDVYSGGNLLSTPLIDLWNESRAIGFRRQRSVEDLWGFCRTCDFGDVCFGGCSFTAHAVLGRPGNNPYCHYRARTLARRGLRERLVRREAAPGVPFDHGIFGLVEEPLAAPDPKPSSPKRLLKVVR
jgi:radical SAM protein with 4Fe4S-binding SPASM domain